MKSHILDFFPSRNLVTPSGIGCPTNVTDAGTCIATSGASTWQPSLGAPLTSDGSLDKWDTSCDGIPMWKAGNSDPTFAGYEEASYAYIHYDCSSSTLCVLVKAKTGIVLKQQDENSYLKIYSSSSPGGAKPPEEGSIQYILEGGNAIAWERCMIVDPNCYPSIQIHSNYGTTDSDTTSTGKTDDLIALDLSCPATTSTTSTATGTTATGTTTTIGTGGSDQCVDAAGCTDKDPTCAVATCVESTCSYSQVEGSTGESCNGGEPPAGEGSNTCFRYKCAGVDCVPDWLDEDDVCVPPDGADFDPRCAEYKCTSEELTAGDGRTTCQRTDMPITQRCDANFIEYGEEGSTAQGKF